MKTFQPHSHTHWPRDLAVLPPAPRASGHLQARLPLATRHFSQPAPRAADHLLTIRVIRGSQRGPRTSGYLLTEALVYIGLLFLILGIGYAAMYRSIDNSVALRRNADDIQRALHAGERWRADVRLAVRGVRWDDTAGAPILRLHGAHNEVDYRFAANALQRRVGSGAWSQLLDHVQSSSMQRDRRPAVTAWRWELELRPQARGSFKPGHVRPLFTFLSVPPGDQSP